MLKQLEDEIIALLDTDECFYSPKCADSGYGSEVRCDDPQMCPSYKVYVVQEIEQLLEYKLEGKND